MLNKIYHCRIFFLLLMVYACTERMELEPNELAIYLSVEATLTNEEMAHTVKLTRTKLIMDTVIPPISSAKVTISDGENEIILIESDTMPGVYFTPDNYKGVSGREYTLKITDVDIDLDGIVENYIGRATMPMEIALDSVTAEPFVLDVFEFSGWSLNCWAWDPPERNYYLFKAWKNDTLVSDTLYEYNFTDDAFFNGQYTNGIECQILDDTKSDEKVKNGDILTLELCHISEDFYNYLIGTITESSPSVPIFSGPPANVPSNISGGAVGFFRVYYTIKGSDTAEIREK